MLLLLLIFIIIIICCCFFSFCFLCVAFYLCRFKSKLSVDAETTSCTPFGCHNSEYVCYFLTWHMAWGWLIHSFCTYGFFFVCLLGSESCMANESAKMWTLIIYVFEKYRTKSQWRRKKIQQNRQRTRKNQASDFCRQNYLQSHKKSHMQKETKKKTSEKKSNFQEKYKLTRGYKKKTGHQFWNNTLS